MKVYPYMGKKDERFPDDLHGDLPYIGDPVGDPPVPNRAWCEMKNGKDVDDLTPEERRDLYVGPDNLI